MQVDLKFMEKDIIDLVRKDVESKGYKIIGDIKVRVGVNQPDWFGDSNQPRFEYVEVTVELKS